MAVKPDLDATKQEKLTAQLSAVVDTFACIWFTFFSLWFLQLFFCPRLIDVPGFFRKCDAMCIICNEDEPKGSDLEDVSKNGKSVMSSDNGGSQSRVTDRSVDLQASQTGTVVTNTVVNTQRWSKVSRKQRKVAEVSTGVRLATLGVFIFGFFCDFTVVISLFNNVCYSVQNNFVVSFWLSHRFCLLVVFTHRLWYMSLSISSKQWKIYGHWLNAWQITTIIMGVISTLHYIFALFVLVSSQTTQTVKQNWIGRVYCLQQFEPPSAVTLAAGLEFLINIVFMLLFMERIRQLKRETGLDNARKIGQMSEAEFSNLRRLYMVGRKVAILTALTVGSTVGVVGVGYAMWRPLGSLAGLDMCLNSLFLFLMFTFNSWMIEPCFGKYCDHLFCIHCNCEFCVPQAPTVFADQRRHTISGTKTLDSHTLKVETPTVTVIMDNSQVQRPSANSPKLTAVREIDDHVLSVSGDGNGGDTTPLPSFDDDGKPLPSLSALAMSDLQGNHQMAQSTDQPTIDLKHIVESDDEF